MLARAYINTKQKYKYACKKSQADTSALKQYIYLGSNQKCK